MRPTGAGKLRFCGTTVIARRWQVTACFWSVSGRQMTLRVSQSYLAPCGPEVIEVRARRRHPVSDGDMMSCRLYRRPLFVWPVAPSTANLEHLALDHHHRVGWMSACRVLISDVIFQVGKDGTTKSKDRSIRDSHTDSKIKERHRGSCFSFLGLASFTASKVGESTTCTASRGTVTASCYTLDRQQTVAPQ